MSVRLFHMDGRLAAGSSAIFLTKCHKSGAVKTQQGRDGVTELLDQMTVRANRCGERRHRDIRAEVGQPPVSRDPAVGGQQEGSQEPENGSHPFECGHWQGVRS